MRQFRLSARLVYWSLKQQQLDSSGNVVNDANGQPVNGYRQRPLGSDGKTQEALTGAYLKPETLMFDTDSSGKPEVAFELIPKPRTLRRNYYGTGFNKTPLGIFLYGT